MKGNEFSPLFSVWSIDAWAEGDSGWTWNDKSKLFEFRTRASDIKNAFLKRLRKYMENPRNRGLGVHGGSGLGRGWYYVQDDWEILELRRRCDDMPVYACIRETPSH